MNTLGVKRMVSAVKVTDISSEAINSVGLYRCSGCSEGHPELLIKRILIQKALW